MADQDPIDFDPEEFQPILLEVSDRPAFPTHALGPLRGAVEYIQIRSCAPIEIAAQSVLAVTASVVQGFANVDRELLGGVSPLSSYFITIAESGERKSACDSLARKPLDDFEQQYHRLFVDAHRQSKVLRSRYEAEFEQHQQMPDMDDGQQRDPEDDAPVEPVQPLSPQRYSTEPTIEGLIKLLAKSHPAHAILSDEGGQFLGGYSMSAEKAKSTIGNLNKAWDGAPLKRIRAGDNNLMLFGRRLSMHLMVQKGVAIDLFADPKAKDMGFLARCLMVEPESRIGFREALTELPDDSAYQAFYHRIFDLLCLDLDYHNGEATEDGRICPYTGALTLDALTLSQPAAEELRKYYNRVEREQRLGGEFEHVRSFASKSPEMAARLAGLLAVYRSESETSIDLDDIRCGIELADYYLREATRIMSRAPAEAKQRDAQKLSDRLSDPNAPMVEFTPSQIQNGGTSVLRNRAYLNEVLGELEKFGHIKRLSPGTVVGGVKRTIAYRLHPNLCPPQSD